MTKNLRAQEPIPLSAQLRWLARDFAHRPASMNDAVKAVQGQGHSLVVILLALPFLTPIPLPMLSPVLGTAMTMIGLRLALGQQPRLPKSLLMKQLPPTWLPRILNASSRVVGILEWGLRPRFQWIEESPIFTRARAVLIMLCGLMLMLPLPVPFSNFLPAAAALLFAASELGRDGLMYFIGVLVFGLSAAFFSLLALGGTSLVNRIFGG